MQQRAGLTVVDGYANGFDRIAVTILCRTAIKRNDSFVADCRTLVRGSRRPFIAVFTGFYGEGFYALSLFDIFH